MTKVERLTEQLQKASCLALVFDVLLGAVWCLKYLG